MKQFYNISIFTWIITILAVILNLNPGNNFYFLSLIDDHETVGQSNSSEILIYITKAFNTSTSKDKPPVCETHISLDLKRCLSWLPCYAATQWAVTVNFQTTV